jgi:hypothetical protein
MRAALIAIVAAAALLLTGCGGTPDRAELSDQVRESMQETLTNDPNFSDFEMVVVKVHLDEPSGTEYNGVATIKTAKGTEREVPVEVTADGSDLQWRTEPGAFGFAAQEVFDGAP